MCPWSSPRGLSGKARSGVFGEWHPTRNRMTGGARQSCFTSVPSSAHCQTAGLALHGVRQLEGPTMQIPSVTATRDEVVEFFTHGTDDQIALWGVLNNIDVDLAAPLPRDVMVLSAIARCPR